MVLASLPLNTHSDMRQTFLESLWGEGFDRPDCIRILEELITPVVSTVGTQFLDLSAGYGGSCRYLIDDFGCNITISNHYTTPLVVSAAEKIKVTSFDLDTDILPAEQFDCVMMCDSFSMLSNKISALGSLRKALKPDGHLFLLDCILGNARDLSGGVRQWLRDEKKQPWSLRQLEVSFEGLGFAMMTADDISDRYKALVLRGWIGYLQILQKNKPGRDAKEVILKEAERCFRFLSLLESQGVRIYRFHAVKI